ncbi:hypothetical protein MUK42_24897 [Musa troglodytarum]|uniref:NAC domain-containing protein n=1 Tax=Musa troglodytarum TaxID=320322 RepID=A0A9E7EES5_9LILI|nr:hypothetical protein MUK42_24897 [Musa troglodytarum]
MRTSLALLSHSHSRLSSVLLLRFLLSSPPRKSSTEPVDLVPKGYRFLPTAEELVVDYLANWVAGTPLPGRAVAFADVYGTEPWNLLGNDRKEGYFFAERKPKSSGGSRVDRKAGTGSWTLNKRQEPVKSIVDGREAVVGQKSFLSFNHGRRKNSGWTMHEYEMCSSGFERRVLCHIKKSSHQPIAGGNLESTFTEAATETTAGGSSFVGQKRNREESSTRSSEAPNLSKKPCRVSSPPPTAVVQQPVLAPVGIPPESRLPSVAPNEAGLPAAFLRRREQMYGTDDFFFTNLEQVRAFMMSDDTFVASTTISSCVDTASLTSYGNGTDSTTVEAACCNRLKACLYGKCCSSSNIDEDGLLQ